jgi:ADP-ribosylglycohydrolase
MNKERKDRALGALFGQAIGDALGVHDEFKSAKAIVSKERNRLEYVETTRLGNPWPAGEWSDDTEQALCILGAYVLDGHLSACTLAGKFRRWLIEDGRGCGGHTLHVLNHPQFLQDPIGVAHFEWDKSDRWAAPNGAVMRVSAVGILRPWDLNWTERAAVLSAQVTHYDPRCVASAVAVAIAVACLVEGSSIPDALGEASRRAVSYHHETVRFMIMDLEDLQLDEGMDDPEVKRPPIGYTYKCLGASFYALRAFDKMPDQNKGAEPHPFGAVLDEILAAGGDVDTNAAVAGALMGAACGVGNLPPDLVHELVHKDRLIATFRAVLDLNERHIEGA